MPLYYHLHYVYVSPLICKFCQPSQEKLNTCAFCFLRLPFMLPFHRWQSNHHKFRRHHVVSRRDPNTDVQEQTCFLELICVLTLSLLLTVHCGTSRRVSRPRFSRATVGTLWVCPCRPTCAPLCQAPATPLSNCGTSGTACAGRLSQVTSRTSMPSVWVATAGRQICLVIYAVLLSGMGLATG